MQPILRLHVRIWAQDSGFAQKYIWFICLFHRPQFSNILRCWADSIFSFLNFQFTKPMTFSNRAKEPHRVQIYLAERAFLHVEGEKRKLEEVAELREAPSGAQVDYHRKSPNVETAARETVHV